ncbi:MAG: SpoIID/LytB domain-containing protein [Phycisphaerae bacterium]|nr:SpoIID/LytB domain-containing protein [Phycisphaerae bacterium]
MQNRVRQQIRSLYCQFSASERGVRIAAVAGAVTLLGLFVGCLAVRETRPPDVRDDAAAPATVDRIIRVRLLGATPVEAIQLAVGSPHRIRDGATGRVLATSARALPPVRVRAATAQPGAILIDATRYDSSDLLIEPQDSGSVRVDDRAFRGSLRIQSTPGGLTVTNILDIEDYVRGVLRGELPRNFHPQAQLALAVAARTYAFYQKVTAGTTRDYDVLADERSQMYIGVEGEDRVASSAVDETRGQVCFVHQDGRDRLFCTYYSSTCGGVSQGVGDFRPSDPRVPPLDGGVRCDGCSKSPYYRWPSVRLSKAEITRRVLERYPRLARLGQITKVIADGFSPEGRVSRVRLIGSGGASDTLVGEDFRLAVGGRVLKSTAFKLTDEGKTVRFSDGRGFGHGVGLCQYGADDQARTGRNYREILQFYYPGSIIKTLY